MKNNFKILALCMLLVSACSSGKKHLEKGNYDLAVFKAVNRLQQTPNHKKASKALQEAYSLAVKGHLDNVNYFKKTSDVFKYDDIVKAYGMILKLNNEVKKYPKYTSLVRLYDVEDDYIVAKNTAAETHEAKGDQLLKEGTKHAAREAYRHYEDANYYVQGIVPSIKLQEAQSMGTVVVKLNFINKRSFFKTFNTKLFYNEVRNRFKNSGHRFLYVMEEEEMEFDEVIDVELNELIVSGIDNNKETKTYTKRVFVGEFKNDSGEVVQEYADVSANYTIYTRSISSSAYLMIQRARYSEDAPEFRKVIPSTYTWTEQWSRFNGDERALTKEQLDMANLSEPSIPNPLFLIEQATQPLIHDCSAFLWTQYNYLK